MPINLKVPQIILESIVERRAQKGRVIVAIDGRGGAGKSSLARAIGASVPDSIHIEYDWFHLTREKTSSTERFDNQRLVNELIKPFRAGQKSVLFERYNWGYLAGKEDGFDPMTVSLLPGAVIILEGVSTLNTILNQFYDIRIWLNTSPEESLRRGISRDIEEYKLDPARVHAAWKEWVSWEARDSVIDERKSRADFVL